MFRVLLRFYFYAERLVYVNALHSSRVAAMKSYLVLLHSSHSFFFFFLSLLLLLLSLGPLPRHMEVPRLGVELEL